MAASFCSQCQREQTYKRRYDITVNDYKALLKQQNNKCAVCGSIDPGRFKMFVVDHDHSKSGKDSVRGLLCNKCNCGLGQFDDNPERLVAAAGYLLRAKK